MHKNSELLFRKYALSCFKPGMTVLEIGPTGPISEYRRMLPSDVKYFCATLENPSWGNQVIRMNGEYSIECPAGSFDIVFSGQVIEHVKKPWLWLKELARVTRQYVVTICPVSWEFHEYPVDCWRIYPDGLRALYEDAGLIVQLSECETLDEGVVDTITVGSRSNFELALLEPKLFMNPDNVFKFDVHYQHQDFTTKQCRAVPVISDEMISCKFDGGLGNQLFEAAHVLAQGWKHNRKSVFMALDTENKHRPIEAYMGNIFRNLEFIDKSAISTFELVQEQCWQFREMVPEKGKNIIFNGLFQSTKNFFGFDDRIRDVFAPTEEFKAEMLSKYPALAEDNTVSVHVRRGDYLGRQCYHPVISEAYISKAVETISGYSHMFVFSDDKQWVRDNLHYDNMTIVDEEDWKELWMMSMCKNNIISNSTFSWWGAFLNPNKDKKVCCPDKWFTSYWKELMGPCDDIFVQGWKRIPTNAEVKNKVCVVTAYNDAYALLGDLTSGVNRLYCTRRGYDIRVHREGFDSSRAMTWNKILFIRQALEDYEWVFWIDADAMFTNHDIPIEKFIQRGGDFFICMDVPAQGKFNAGVMLLRRCDFTFWMLDEIWKRNDLANVFFHEQTALNDLYESGKLNNHVVWYPTRAFNSFTFASPEMLCGAPESDYVWQKGDFVAHCPGKRVYEKMSDFAKVIDVCRNQR